jgi:hypothetical protein
MGRRQHICTLLNVEGGFHKYRTNSGSFNNYFKRVGYVPILGFVVSSVMGLYCQEKEQEVEV